ncbi:chlorophyll a/b-binding protein [Prochlorococcus marinus]|uniref:Uncharacterized protein n=1 Tax=Prochlorococcus marinus (strain MIT 9211) TaxID=93059 RepID=A9B9T3_PROM4|nr:chlorophyll a/b-binding protein [Prochlorococcus marinus]ABX08595.1 Hypothetical protein P9211_06641 [Prochlorococcus marinus str. MIT 9211]
MSQNLVKTAVTIKILMTLQFLRTAEVINGRMAMLGLMFLVLSKLGPEIFSHVKSVVI